VLARLGRSRRSEHQAQPRFDRFAAVEVIEKLDLRFLCDFLTITRLLIGYQILSVAVLVGDLSLRATISTMSVRQQEMTRTWTFNGGAHQALAALRTCVTDAGGKIVGEADDSLSARIGSRLAMRMFGVLMPAGRGRIPMKIDISVRAVTAERTQVTATASSDPGWYSMSTHLGTDAYDMALPQLLDYVQGS
jgi:hypothetical protein